MNSPIIELEHIHHRGGRQVAFRFPYEAGLHERMKQMPGAQWSRTFGCWYAPWSGSMVEKARAHFAGMAMICERGTGTSPAPGVAEVEHKPEASPLSTVNAGYIRQLEAWMRTKRYSANTIKVYADALRVFCRWAGDRPLPQATAEDMVRFNHEHIVRRKLSATYQNQFVNALKLLFNVCKFGELTPAQLYRPRRARALPHVLAKEEMKQILDATRNVKHRAMLTLIYSAGLRCGDLIGLRLADIDMQRLLMHIHHGKGARDRVVPLSPKVKLLLQEYITAYRPGEYLFEGQAKGPYDERSLQQVLKQSVARAGIQKPVTLHWLRHSYATHLLESGTNLRYIQELLGHKHSRTTEIYTHVGRQSLSAVQSPFDTL